MRFFSLRKNQRRPGVQVAFKSASEGSVPARFASSPWTAPCSRACWRKVDRNRNLNRRPGCKFNEGLFQNLFQSSTQDEVIDSTLAGAPFGYEPSHVVRGTPLHTLDKRTILNILTEARWEDPSQIGRAHV